MITRSPSHTIHFEVNLNKAKKYSQYQLIGEVETKFQWMKDSDEIDEDDDEEEKNEDEKYGKIKHLF